MIALSCKTPDQEICEQIDIPEGEVVRILELMQPVYMVPLDGTIGGNDTDEQSVHELIADLTEENARDRCEKEETIGLIKQALKDLPKKQQQVMLLYYYEGLRLAEIAKVLDLTESRICQIHANAVNFLRVNLKKTQFS